MKLNGEARSLNGSVCTRDKPHGGPPPDGIGKAETLRLSLEGAAASRRLRPQLFARTLSPPPPFRSRTLARIRFCQFCNDRTFTDENLVRGAVSGGPQLGHEPAGSAGRSLPVPTSGGLRPYRAPPHSSRACPAHPGNHKNCGPQSGGTAWSPAIKNNLPNLSPEWLRAWRA